MKGILVKKKALRRFQLHGESSLVCKLEIINSDEELGPVDGAFSGHTIGSNMPREWLLGFPALTGVMAECSKVRPAEALWWHTEKIASFLCCLDHNRVKGWVTCRGDWLETKGRTSRKQENRKMPISKPKKNHWASVPPESTPVDNLFKLKWAADNQHGLTLGSNKDYWAVQS